MLLLKSSPSQRPIGRFSAPLQRLDQGEQLVHQLILGDLFDDLSLFEQQALPYAACDAAVGGAGLTGAVDHTAHDRHRDGLVH